MRQVAHDGSWPLLGRGEELRSLHRLVDEATAGRGGVGFVEGPAGIGKSRLLEAAVAAARSGPGTALRARGSELEREFAFGVARQLYEPLLAAAAPPERERLLDGAAALAEPLIGPSGLERPVPGGDNAHASLHGLYWLTVNVATPTPLVLVVDDAHWVDGPTLRFLAYLANRIDELPVALVLAARPHEPGADLELLDELAAGPAASVIRPGPLDVPAIEEVARTEWGEEVHGEFVRACAEASGGNPLYLRELLVTLAAEGVRPTADTAPRVAQVAPASIARSVARRLRRLEPEAIRLAEALAVLGDRADPRAVAALSGLDDDVLARAAGALRTADILDPRELAFAHPVVRGAVYSDRSAAERSRQHRQAVVVLTEAGADEDALAVQALAAEPTGDAGIVEILRRAARRARARGAPEVAVAYLERALAEPPSPARRAELLVEIGHTEVAVLRSSGLEHMRRALDVTDDPALRARVAFELGRALLGTANFPEAASVLDEARQALPEVADPELASQLDAQVLAASILTPARTPVVAGEVLRLMEDPASVADPVLLAALGAAIANMFPPAGIGADLATRALADGRLSLESDAVIVCMAAITLMSADRLDQAAAVWDRAQAEARQLGSPMLDGMTRSIGAFTFVRRGELDRADADAGHSPQVLDAEWRGSLLIAFTVPSVVDILVERGALDRASDLLVEQGLTGDLPDIVQMSFVLDSVGRLRIAQGRHDEAIALLRECGRRMTGWGLSNPGLIPWQASLAPALAAVGDREEAGAVAEAAVERGRRFEVPRELGMGLRAAALVAGGDEGIALLQEAVSTLAPTPARLEHARALTDLGAALRRRGFRSDAREPLRQAVDLAQRCGATVLARRAHEELVAAGARPRRLQTTGAQSLTGSERRVANLVAEGMTNRQVAQALFVTEKTVEGHLAHVYRKLQISARSQLAEALVPDGVASGAGSG